MYSTYMYSSQDRSINNLMQRQRDKRQLLLSQHSPQNEFPLAGEIFSSRPAVDWLDSCCPICRARIDSFGLPENCSVTAACSNGQGSGAGEGKRTHTCLDILRSWESRHTHVKLCMTRALAKEEERRERQREGQREVETEMLRGRIDGVERHSQGEALEEVAEEDTGSIRRDAGVEGSSIGQECAPHSGGHVSTPRSEAEGAEAEGAEAEYAEEEEFESEQEQEEEGTQRQREEENAEAEAEEEEPACSPESQHEVCEQDECSLTLTTLQSAIGQLSANQRSGMACALRSMAARPALMTGDAGVRAVVWSVLVCVVLCVSFSVTRWLSHFAVSPLWIWGRGLRLLLG